MVTAVVRSAVERSSRGIGGVLRRSFLYACFAALVAGFALAALQGGDAARAGAGATTGAVPERPNILLIVSDDQAWSTFNRSLMPNVHRELVDEGVLFTRGYLNTPLCCPSRAQIMTGLYAGHTGVDHNSVRLFRPTIIHALKGLGYRTMLAGKFMNNTPCTPRPEFDEWVCTGDVKAHYTMVDPEMNVNGTWTTFDGYTTDIQADMVANFIASTPAEQPFFVMHTPTTPHLPANDDRCSSLPVEPLRDASFDEETRTSGKPRWVQRPPLTTSEIGTVTRQHRFMTQAVSCLDSSLGRIFDALGARKDNTLVFYLSDNGYLYGQHRRWEKVVPYEESIRVPFIVRYPALFGGPVVSDALVQNVDIAATIADVVGIDWRADGRSLLPVLTFRKNSVRDSLLIEHCQATTYPCPGNDVGNLWGQLVVPSYLGVVTPMAKYVEYITGEEELYVLRNDPAELDNVAGEPAYERLKGFLRTKLARLTEPVVDTTIVTGPQGTPTDFRSFTFTYFSPSHFSRYRCRLTRDETAGTWHPCNGQSILEGPLADGDYLFEVQGVDEDGVTDATPAGRAFSLVTEGPDVAIDSAPPLDGSATSASFAFSSTTAGVSFECRLLLVGQTGAWSPCASPRTYSSLATGLWRFQVRAVTATGARTRPPAEWLFRISSRGPLMLFDAAPNAFTQDDAARFVFHPDELTKGPISCSLDGGASVDCTNGSLDLVGLSPGSHVLQVTAADKSNIVATTSYSWKIDRTPPTVTITDGPDSPSGSSVSFTFAADEPLSGRWCRLDDGFMFAPCTSPVTYSGLADGEHTFTVMVADKADNYSERVSWTWVQDTSA
jgi:N-acetylglucosamine-6-sulfatase